MVDTTPSNIYQSSCHGHDTRSSLHSSSYRGHGTRSNTAQATPNYTRKTTAMHAHNNGCLAYLISLVERRCSQWQGEGSLLRGTIGIIGLHCNKAAVCHPVWIIDKGKSPHNKPNVLSNIMADLSNLKFT